MFLSGCLEWINLSNRLSSVDTRHICPQTARRAHKQAGKQVYTHGTFAHTFALSMHSFAYGGFVISPALPRARSHLCFTYIKCSLFPWFGLIIRRTIDQCSSMCRSIRQSTIPLLFCAWIQHGPMLTPGLQLYNCPAYSMQGKWLNKRERRTLCHSSFFFFLTAVLHVSKSVLHRNVSIRNVKNS